MKTSKEELLSNCTNKHDKKLMEKELDKFEKIQKKAHLLMWITTFFIIIGVVGLQFNDYFILSFIPVFPLMLGAMYYNFKSSGLF